MSARDFTTDWSASIDHWPDLFGDLDLAGKPDLRFLEVGCFEGRTTLWLLAHVLTDPASLIVVVDPFSIDEQRDRFNRNLMPYLEGGKVRVWPYDSSTALRHASALGGPFDFVYVDGDHTARQVLEDAVLAWALLRPGGAMVFDDAYWPEVEDELDKPTVAVEAFVRCYRREIARSEPSGRDQHLVVKAGP